MAANPSYARGAKDIGNSVALDGVNVTVAGPCPAAHRRSHDAFYG